MIGIKEAALAVVGMAGEARNKRDPRWNADGFSKHDLCMVLFTMQALSMTDVYSGCAPLFDGVLYRDGDLLCSPAIDEVWPEEPSDGFLAGGSLEGVSKELKDKAARALLFQNSWASPNHRKLLARIMDRTGLAKSGPLQARKLGRQEYTAFSQKIWHADEWELERVQPYYRNPFFAGTVEAGLFTMAQDHWDAFVGPEHRHVAGVDPLDVALLILQKSGQYGLQGRVNIRALQYMVIQTIQLLNGTRGFYAHINSDVSIDCIRRFPYGPGCQSIHDEWGKWGRDPIPSSAFSYLHAKRARDNGICLDESYEETMRITGYEEVKEPVIEYPLVYYAACLVVARAANPNMTPIWERLHLRALFLDRFMHHEEGRTRLHKGLDGSYEIVKGHPYIMLHFQQQTILPNGKENIITGHPCDLAYAGLGHPKDGLCVYRNAAFSEYRDGNERDPGDCYNDIFEDTDSLDEAYLLYDEYVSQRDDIDSILKRESDALKQDEPEQWATYCGSDDFEKIWSMYHGYADLDEGEEEDDTPLPPPKPDTEKDWDEGICGPSMADQDAFLMEEFARDHGEES